MSGTWLVGKDIPPGIYRCDGEINYWARLSGLGGKLGDIIANGALSPSPVYVEILESDLAFETKGSGIWYKINLNTYKGQKSTTFKEGSFIVGKDIEPGLYRTANGFNYWARLTDFTGSIHAIIANSVLGRGPSLVEIEASDFGFEATGKSTWQKIDLDTYTGQRLTTFGDGMYIVGKDIEPGWYRARNGCDYWARLRDFSGQISSILANDALCEGQVLVEIKETDTGFQTIGAMWERIP